MTSSLPVEGQKLDQGKVPLFLPVEGQKLDQGKVPLFLPVEGQKLDQGKVPLWEGLFEYFPDALEAVAANSLAGYAKYKTWGGWRTVPDAIRRYSSAMMRHVMRRARGERFNDEAGFTHIRERAMIAWNALATLQLEIDEERKAASSRTDV